MRKKKLLIAGLTMATVLGLAACQKQDSEEKEAKKQTDQAEKATSEFTYVAEDVQFADEEGLGSSVAFGKNAIYSIGSGSYTDGGNQGIKKRDCQSDGTIGDAEKIIDCIAQSIAVDAQGNIYAITTGGNLPFTIQNANEEIYDIEVDDSTAGESPDQKTGESLDGTKVSDHSVEDAGADRDSKNAKTMEDAEDGAVDGGEIGNIPYSVEDMPKISYNLVKYSPEGEKLYETDLSTLVDGADWFYAQHFFADEKGRVYIYSNQVFYLFDENGKQKGEIEPGRDTYVSGAGVAKNGKAYFCNYVFDGEKGGNTLTEIDFDNCKMGNTYKNFVSADGSFDAGIEKDILVKDQNGLYEYSLETQEADKILSWVDCDIDGNQIQKLTMLENGSILAVVNDPENGVMNNQLVKFNKVKSSEVVQKQIITVGTLYDNQQLSKQIIEFNKSNDKYRIKLKTYMDMNNISQDLYKEALERMNNEIISGDCPDILNLQGLNVNNLISKGVVDDLNGFLEKSTTLQKEDFVDGILDSAEIDGKLAYIPSGFMLMSLVGSKKIVGDRQGISVDDMIALAKKYPDAKLLEYQTRGNIVLELIMLDYDKYINQKTGECHFDSDEFRKILEFAKTFPEEMDLTVNSVTPIELQKGELLLADATISSYNQLQMIMAYFGDEESCFVGYPCANEGNGCIIAPVDQLSISSKSNNKEGAWEFIENLINTNEMIDRWSVSGFPSKKENFDKAAESAMEVEYVLDGEGNQMTDENGDPIINGLGSVMMMGDDGETWELKLKPITEKEVNLVKELLEGAKSINMSLDEEIQKIITEEADGFFKGDKSLDEVVDILQNRVSLYIKENS